MLAGNGPVENVSNRLRALLDVAASVAVIVLALTMVYVLLFRDRNSLVATGSKRPAAAVPLPSKPLSLSDAVTLGAAEAKLVVIEYSDFQCPYCARFAEQTFSDLRRTYIDTGKILFVFRHFPLSEIHSAAVKAAQAAECAGQQQHFWEMHDVLFRQRAYLDEEHFRAFALQLGLDVDAFGRCLGGDTISKIRRDVAGAKALLVSGTPTFFVGLKRPDGRVDVVDRVEGAVAFRDFQAKIAPLLAKLDSTDVNERTTVK
jgi:protein-disulfide isomerase